ncbi:MAG: DUF4832 domain-containing protein [Spirochaetes bacterium]|nr:DUF4832 domain-containing protein [Spirochaetota bacterium]
MLLAKKNLEQFWDETMVCRNPHKGWYIHYYDNGLKKYGATLAPGDLLEDFPGLNHLYIRVGWSYLEPEEGDFRWEFIDDFVKKWEPAGYRFSVRITCKETSADQAYATPEWVRNEGVPGTEIPCAAGGFTWEPDYGHPLFMKKLEHFHRAFAQRYDGKPWLEYVDIGSYGDWGEAHTASSSKRDWPADVIKRHIDIHCRQYRKTQLMISDDVVGSRKDDDETKQDILAYIKKKGVSMRDDGVCVVFFAENFGLSTLRSPEFFEHFWRERPVDLELEHYQTTVDKGTWKNGVPYEKAIEEAHATYVGFHGYPREWLAENRSYAERIANKAGYWYFIRSIEYPQECRAGIRGKLRLVWENRGVAPAYHRYPATIRIIHNDSGIEHVITPDTMDNRRWMPRALSVESCEFSLPADFPKGACGVYISMADGDRPLMLPFQSRIIHKLHKECYRIATLTVVP